VSLGLQSTNPYMNVRQWERLGKGRGRSRNGRIWIWETKDDEMGRQIWTNTVGLLELNESE
jgi:hypothetical protein